FPECQVADGFLPRDCRGTEESRQAPRGAGRARRGGGRVRPQGSLALPAPAAARSRSPDPAGLCGLRLPGSRWEVAPRHASFGSTEGPRAGRSGAGRARVPVPSPFGRRARRIRAGEAPGLGGSDLEARVVALSPGPSHTRMAEGESPEGVG